MQEDYRNPNSYCVVLANEPGQLNGEFNPRKTGFRLGAAQMLEVDWERRGALWFPSAAFVRDPLRPHQLKRAQQMEYLLQTMTNAGDPSRCWIWSGTTRGGYPSAFFWGKPKGAFKVLLAHLCAAAVPEDFSTRRHCKQSWCMNPTHHVIESFFNTPAQGIDGEITWRTNKVFPWEPLEGGNGPTVVYGPKVAQVATPEALVRMFGKLTPEEKTAPQES